MKARMVVTVVAMLIASGCAQRGPEPDTPIRAIAKEGGMPVSWKPDDRVVVEGRLVKTPDGHFLIKNTSLSGRLANETRFFLRGIDNPWQPLWWKAYFISYRGKLASVTGTMPALSGLAYKPPNRDDYNQYACLFALEVEQLKSH